MSTTPPAISLTVLLLALMVVSSYSEGSRFTESLPVRTVLCVPLLLGIIAQSLAQGRRIVSLRLGWLVIALWIALVAWIFLTSIVNGVDLVPVVRKFVGRHFTALVAMLAIVWCARGRARHQWIVLFLSALIAFSAFIAILQWRGLDWAWNLRTLVNVPTESIDLDTMILEPTKTLVSGLYGTAFTCSYFMVVGTLLLLPMTLDSRWRFLVIGPFLAVCVALVIVQERSGLVSAALCALLCFLEMLRRAKGRMLNIVLIVLMMSFGGGYAAVWVARQAQGSARYDLYRYTDFSSESRLIAAEQAIALAGKYPLFGVAGEDFEGATGTASAITPHNLFLNGLVFYGVPGLLLTLALAGAQTWLAWTVWRIAWKNNDYASVGCALAMIGYLLNCQFHNASMLNGDHLGWWLTGLLIASRQNEKVEIPAALTHSERNVVIR